MTRPVVPVVDLHADLLWRVETTGKDPWADCPGEMLDLPRMLEHGPSLQCFTLFTPAEHTGQAATAYADKLLGIWKGLVERGGGRITWVRDRNGLDGLDPAGLAGVLTMEGASPLRGDLSVLDRYHEDGVRMLGLTHNPRNEAGDGCMVDPDDRGGLTAFGRALVGRCAQLGIVVDVAHLAPEGVRDVIDEVVRMKTPVPVISSHTGCLSLTLHPRNLDDLQLLALAATGGLAGITLYPPHIARDGHPDRLDNALDHVEHVVDTCGIDHVALGADLDGFDPPGLPGGADTPLCYGQIADSLSARDYSDAHIAQILGGNALRVLRSVLR